MKIQTYKNADRWQQGQDLIKAEIATKESAHDQGLLHLSTHLLIIDNQGKICCRKRWVGEERYAYLWTTTIGVHVELDSNYILTLKNHLPMEMSLEWIGEFRVNDSFENEICGLYIAKLDENMLPSAFMVDRSFLRKGDLETYILSNSTTPHLREAYHLLKKIR